ncbi:MAG: PilN domain-containing protein [Nitrospinaceae bacterium]|nr:MAG: PilN domain-containing protein [Nitrospinaceae bacterium]
MKTIYIEKSLGIDIRENSVALVLLGKSFRSIDILGGKFFRILPLTPGDEKAEKVFLERMNKAMLALGTWPDNQTVSLPRRHYTLLSFELPAPDQKSARAMVPFELERHFSSGLENLLHACHIRTLGEKKQHVTAAALKKETADYYLGLLRQLSLKPSALDVSTLANLNLVTEAGDRHLGLVAIADQGPEGFDVTLVRQGRLAFSHNVTLDDPDIREAFFKTDLPQDAGDILAAGMAEIVIEEIQKALASCRTLDDAVTVEQLHLAGAGPFAPALAGHLEKRSEVPTTRVTLPRGTRPVPGKKFAVSFMGSALGLAMRGLRNCAVDINLLPPALSPKRRKANLKTTLGLAAAAVLLAAAGVLGQWIQKTRTLDHLDEQLREIKAQAGALEKIDLQYETLRENFGRLATIDQAHPLKLPVLQELSRTLPKDTWLTNIDIKKDTLEIKGYSAVASKLVPLLENSPHFKETGFVGTIINDRGKEKFTIRTRIKERP